ncbi:peptidoglycan recognition family protein [Clostridium chrysemydis]|uniref:peptidoglycan recognition protein family protein n=1 Tax=Clostridium chrysemydis TaxID=2665504 RepID=UPI0018837001|nr:peptidoglycan recognition family protein [Clostridium chrysemydis]
MRNILKGLKRFKRNRFEAKKVPKINEVNYKWAKPLTYTLKPTTIIYHHIADDNITPEKIHQLHLDRGWAGIGYHFYIRKDGTIYRGRPENAVGSHAPGYNSKAFGIALEGNFNNQKPTEKQIQSLIDLSNYLIDKYNIKEIKRHKDVKNTECPGSKFPFEEIKAKLNI